MDIYADGVGIVISKEATTLTIADTITPAIGNKETAKTLNCEWVCVIQLGSSRTARVLAIIGVHDKDKQHFASLLKNIDKIINIDIEKTVVGFPQARIKTNMTFSVGLVQAFFMKSKDFVEPSWQEEVNLRFNR
jgi:hypothetical protein